jgi:tryptophan-rich sensory protein
MPKVRPEEVSTPMVWMVIVFVAGALAIVIWKFSARAPASALLSALIVALGLQLATRLQLGYFDPFWPIALVVSFGGTFVVALISIFIWRRLTGLGGHTS